jgi:hypothetical protein
VISPESQPELVRLVKAVVATGLGQFPFRREREKPKQTGISRSA